MEQIHSDSQEIFRFLWNPKVHYRVHNSPPLDTIPSQINPIHNLSRYFSKIHTNIALPSTPRASEWSLPFRFSDQNLYALVSYDEVCKMMYQEVSN